MRRPVTPQDLAQAKASTEDDKKRDFVLSPDPEVARLQIEQFMAKLIVRGVTRSEMAKFIPNASEQLLGRCYNTILRRWKDEHAAEADFHRSLQVRRLMKDLVDMRSQPRKPYLAINRHETLLSDILGTKAPLRFAKLDVDTEMREAMAAVLGRMTRAELETFVDTDGYELAAAE